MRACSRQKSSGKSNVIEWVQVSGDIAADARYLNSLRGMKNGIALRQRELRRLAMLHGDGYRMNVERALRGGDGYLPGAEVVTGGRVAAMEQMKSLLDRRG